MGQKIAVVGAGIAGMSAAWLLSQRHAVTLFEQDPRLGGHANTVDVCWPDGQACPVDTGFIVYNVENYPNLTALFSHLDVETRKAEMDFAVSLDGGSLEYGSAGLGAILAQKRNLLRPRFWAMLRDVLRFYREAPVDETLGHNVHISIGDYLSAGGYGAAFLDDHILPQAAAIWSTSVGDIRDYPAASMVRFFNNHGLLKLTGRPQWRTVCGGSTAYVAKLSDRIAGQVRLGCGVRQIRRAFSSVEIEDQTGKKETFDKVLIAAHADDALAMLGDPSPVERQLLGAFRYSQNRMVLHTDPGFMPQRRAAWSSWNYIGDRQDRRGRCVTYWMNRLQGIRTPEPLFVTLNPKVEPSPCRVHREETYAHPVFDAAAIVAQQRLWELQGQRCTWFCGAHFGSGFHEDALQSGLAAAEALGGVRRPWTVRNESGRIFLGPWATRDADANELVA